MVQRGLHCDTTVHCVGMDIPVYVIVAAEVSESAEIAGEIIEMKVMVGLRGSNKMCSLGYLYYEKLTFPVLFSEKWYEVMMEAVETEVAKKIPEAVVRLIGNMQMQEFTAYAEYISNNNHDKGENEDD